MINDLPVLRYLMAKRSYPYRFKARGAYPHAHHSWFEFLENAKPTITSEVWVGGVLMKEEVVA